MSAAFRLAVDDPCGFHCADVDPPGIGLARTASFAKNINGAGHILVFAEQFHLDLRGDLVAEGYRIHALAGVHCVKQCLDIEQADPFETRVLQCMEHVGDAGAVDESLDLLHGLSSASCCALRSARSSSHSYITGSRISVNKVELIRPPTTTVARGRCVSAPTPLDSNIGTNPRMATLAVINTGRRRRSAPCTTASRTVRPLPRNSFRKVTSTMPLSIATPNTAMNPIAEGTDRYWPVMNNPTSPPIVANGTLARIRAAYLIELNAVYSSTKMKKIVTGTITASRANARCWFSKAPPHSIQYPAGSSTLCSMAADASFTKPSISRPRTSIWMTA